jgi:hypothetical protein
MKICARCKFEKNDNEFYTLPNGSLRSYCKVCHNADVLVRATKNREKENIRQRAWRAAYPGRASAIARNWQLRHPEKFKAVTIKREYNVDFDALWEAQGGLCASCHRPMVRKGRESDSVCVDHDRSCCPGSRSCGKCVRGLVHRNCNLVLGYAKDDPEIIRSAIEYLEHWRSLAQ